MNSRTTPNYDPQTVGAPRCAAEVPLLANPRLRIMLVDDHPGFRQVVKALLQKTGAEFVECSDGAQAVRDYTQLRPDLVLMDIAMKGMDGLSATAQIRAACPEARVFMLTQYDDSDLRSLAERAGAAGYLLKDDLSQLQALVSSVTRQTRTDAE